MYMKSSLAEKLINFATTLVILGVFIFSVSYFGEDRVKEIITSSGVLAPLLMILMKILTIVVAPLSWVALYLFAGTLFGVTKGFVYVMIGDAIWYSIAFWISRHFWRKKVESYISRNESGLLSKIVKGISGIKGFLVTCCIFSFAADLVAYAAGLSRLPFRYFLPIFMTGDALAAYMIIWSSDKIGINWHLIVVVVGSVGLFSLISWLASRWVKRWKN